MSEYDNTDKGVLFKNDRKESDRHPDLKGNITFKCPSCGDVHDYWMSGWRNTSQAGVPYVSIKINLKEQQHQQGMESARQAAGVATAGGGMPPAPNDFDDDIPF